MKKYPFSVRKHGHDIEYYRDYLFCRMCDMEVGTIPYNKNEYDKMYDTYYGILDEISSEMYGEIAYLTGEQIGFAKRVILWATEKRAAKMNETGNIIY